MQSCDKEGKSCCLLQGVHNTLHLTNVQIVQNCRTHLWCIHVQCSVRRHDSSTPQKQQDSFAATSPHQGACGCSTQQQRRQQCSAECIPTDHYTVLLSTQKVHISGGSRFLCQNTVFCEGKGRCRCCLQAVQGAELKAASLLVTRPTKAAATQ